MVCRWSTESILLTYLHTNTIYADLIAFIIMWLILIQFGVPALTEYESALPQRYPGCAYGVFFLAIVCKFHIVNFFAVQKRNNRIGYCKGIL